MEPNDFDAIEQELESLPRRRFERSLDSLERWLAAEATATRAKTPKNGIVTFSEALLHRQDARAALTNEAVSDPETLARINAAFNQAYAIMIASLRQALGMKES